MVKVGQGVNFTEKVTPVTVAITTSQKAISSQDALF